MNESQEPEIRRMLDGAVPPLPEPEDRLVAVRARVRRGRLRTGAVAAGVVLVAGIAVGVPRVLMDGAESPAEPAGAPEDIYQGNVMVMQTGEDAPRMCWPAAPTTLLPSLEPAAPDCSGPANEVAGWSWADVAADAADGTSWGTYFVTGTWDGQRFTLTAPPRPADADAIASYMAPADFASACAEPAGGWRPVDRALATEDAFNEVTTWAREQPEFAGVWIDQSAQDGIGGNVEEGSNDPTRFVLNLRFVGDPALWEPRVREIWGGALCVTSATHSLAERYEVSARIQEEFPFPATLMVNDDEVAGVVRADVLVATPELRAEFDRRYGPEMVALHGWLEPVG